MAHIHRRAGRRRRDLRRHQRRPVAGMHIARADGDESDDHGQLDEHHDVVDRRRLRNTRHQQAGDGADHQRGRQVQHPNRHHVSCSVCDRYAWRRGKRWWNMDADILQEADAIAGPPHRNRRGGEAVFQQQQQAHHPGHDLAHGGVGIGIGRTRHRQGRGQFGIAQSHKRAEHAGDDEGDHDAGAGELRRGPASQNEDPGADDAPDTEENQVQRAQGPLQLAMFVFGLNLRDRFSHEYTPDTSAGGYTIRHLVVPVPFLTRPSIRGRRKLAMCLRSGNLTSPFRIILPLHAVVRRNGARICPELDPIHSNRIKLVRS